MVFLYFIYFLTIKSELYPGSLFRLVLIDVSVKELEENRNTIEKLIYPRNTVLDFNIGGML